MFQGVFQRLAPKAGSVLCGGCGQAWSQPFPLPPAALATGYKFPTQHLTTKIYRKFPALVLWHAQLSIKHLMLLQT